MKVELISLVIPCYNENLVIDEFYSRAVELGNKNVERRFEFIFVNDGSTDKTGIILNQIAQKDKRVKVLHLARNRGHQIALTAGLDHAAGDIIVTIDADLQDPPELIEEMLYRIEQGCDVVHTQRRSRDGETFFKVFSASFFYRLMRFAANTPIIENCGDFRAITRPVLETVLFFRTQHRFLRGIFAQIGFNQCIIPYDRDSRYAGDTKYPFFKMLNLSLDAILGFSSAPIRVITWLSIALWSSLIYLVKALIEHFLLQITVPGWTSIIVMQFFFTGLVLFCIAIIGAYVGRIFEQGQQQPLYWLCDSRNVDWTRIGSCNMDLPELALSERIHHYAKGRLSWIIRENSSHGKESFMTSGRSTWI